MFTPVDYSRIESALSSPRGWWELAVIATCALFAWLADRRLERARAARTPMADSALAFSVRGLARASFPLLALVLLFLARTAYRHFSEPFFIDVALPLLLAFAATRLLIYGLRRLFPAQRWLPAWERGISLAVLLALVLYYVGAVPDITAEMDALKIPLGKQEVSLLAIGKGALMVLVTLIITLWISGTVEQRLIASETLEGNLRVVLAKFIRAVLLVVAVLLSLQAVGLDLTVLTVFGGAVGVGIGLGLQKLASNYIAGFTILLDRSIRLGDLVTVDNRFGMIAKVTSRYVVVRSLDGVEAIVPNETLVTTTVLNHSYTTKEIRMAVAVQVGYDSNVEQALHLLEEVAAAEQRVLATPAPKAFMVRFGESGIDLELGVWLNDPEAGQLDLRSALNRRILAAFRTHGIVIPCPQREVRIVGEAGRSALAGKLGPGG